MMGREEGEGVVVGGSLMRFFWRGDAGAGKGGLTGHPTYYSRGYCGFGSEAFEGWEVH